MTPQQFVDNFLVAPNAAAASQDFDFYNEFHAKQAGRNADLNGPLLEKGGVQFVPQVGDWYHLEIPGNNGDVMIVDKDTDMKDGRISATVQTMTDEGLGPAENHPVSGRRQFGLEKLKGGGYRFYTRGFDRAEGATEDNDLSRSSQDKDWTALMKGVASQHGGRPEHRDENGDPVWGWHEHHSADQILKSGVEQQQPCDPEVPAEAPAATGTPGSG